MGKQPLKKFLITAFVDLIRQYIVVASKH